jgi:hypothetical protein
MKLAVWFGGLGLVLPFVLPESAVLSNSAPFQFLERLVPSATKAASVAQYPNVVRVYFSLMLTLAPVLAMYFVIWHEPWRTHISKMATYSAFRRIQGMGGGIFLIAVLTCLNLLFYFLPGTVSADSRGSRGQLLFSVIVMTKSGLAVFGSFLSLGVFVIWWLLLLLVVFVLLIPFQHNHRTDIK